MPWVLQSFLVLSAIFASSVYSASAIPPTSSFPPKPPTAVACKNENDGIGNSMFGYQTSDDTFRDEKVTIKNPDTDEAYPVPEGYYQITAPDGRKFLIFLDDKVPSVQQEPIPSSAIATLQGGFG